MLAAFSAAGFLVHMPFGPRKSGMPESVLIPAPVSTTTRLEVSTSWRARSAADPRSSRSVTLADPNGRRTPDAPRCAGRHETTAGNFGLKY
jgi:hypothetical protein